MTTSTSHSHIAPGYEPIAGYKLEKLIGRGGFGEVWLSEAPGGLHKAVKFVYGTTDQHHAVRELRSLERIKGVHHPFLLTLERFGVVDDRLVIVTELADGSLEEVYNRHRERGSCGIPRASLLSYLHDAADALDYLHSNFQLQHLDIKPGNLLLVGGHVKVGDFGLLKDLRDADCSIVSGLTPIYAPPELFDGRPSMNSDQYSLAVMYQELLTGTRPFGGRTIAQLATQHVHSAPNLAPLPASDRPFIARALEKDPSRRFASCCEFIDALKASSATPIRVTATGADQEPRDTLTGEFRAGCLPTPAVKDLPQFQVAAPRSAVRITGHALVVAVGGAGANVLRLLRERVSSHRAACPLDLHSILIDTDAHSIQAARLAEVSDRVPVCQTVHTPLKSPQQYRAYQGVKYKSISRRWLYNVPRSGQTEGMRPLGRLALIDHSEEVTQQLEESIRHLSAVSGHVDPIVYVVGSLDGGTGSGMLLDVIHVVRHILDSQSLAQVGVIPLLLTGPIQRDPMRPLAAADAAATVHEMRYYLRPGNGYPGDSAANWSPVPSARTPLVDAYVIAAGGKNDETPEPAETICEYIWANSTGAGDFFAAAREVTSDTDGSVTLSKPQIRSVGMVRLRTPKLLEENLLAPFVVRKLIYKWLGDPAEAKELAGALSNKLMRRCGFTSEALLKYCCGSWPVEPDVRFDKLARIVSQLPSTVRENPAEIQNSLRQIAGSSLGKTGEKLYENGIMLLRREIATRLSDGRCDLALALAALKQLEQLVRDAATEARQGRFAEGQQPVQLPPAQAQELGMQAHVWLTRVICCNVGDAYDAIIEEIKKVRERVSDMGSTLAQCVNLVSQRLAGNDNEIWQHIDEAIRERVGSVVGNLSTKVSSSVVGVPVMNHDCELQSNETLLQSLLDCALPLIEASLSYVDDNQFAPASEGLTQTKSDVSLTTAATPLTERRSGEHDGLSTTSITPAQPSAENKQPLRWDDPGLIAQAIRAVRPTLLDCGGCQRMLLIVGSEPERERLEPKVREVYNGPLTTTVVPGSAAMLVCEAQQINLTDLQSRIATVAGNDQMFLNRLASRNDIDWRSALDR